MAQLAFMLQMPQGQTPAQMPQPMQRAGSETYSKPPSANSLRSMAFSGQDMRHILQSRQVPQLTQRSKSSRGCGSSRPWHLAK